MGRVSNKIVKTASKKIVEKYYKRLTLDFYTNKRIIEEVVETPSKKVRNKIAGYTTRLMKRIQRGPVKGISLKMQEYEREKKLDYQPLVSDLDIKNVYADNDTMKMLESIKTRLPETERKAFVFTHIKPIKKDEKQNNRSNQ